MNLFECIMSYSELLTKRYLNVRLRHPVHFVYFVLDMHFHCIKHAKVIEKKSYYDLVSFSNPFNPFFQIRSENSSNVKKERKRESS